MIYSNCRLALQRALQGGDTPGCEAVGFRILFRRRQRPLLIAEPALERVGEVLAWFGRHPALRLAARLQLLADAGWRGAVPLESFPAVPVRTLLNGAGGRIVAMQCGSDGLLQKVSLLLETKVAREFALCKLALGESADEVVVAETMWLERLAACAFLADSVPHLLASGRLGRTGRAFLTMTTCAGAVRKGVTRIDGRHRDFLVKLAQFSCRDVIWPSGVPERRARERLASSPGIPPAAGELLQRTLDRACRLLGDTPLPCVLTHGDFATWNIHLLPDRAYVFDWEYAEAEGNPLADFFHFNLMPGATRAKLPDQRALAALLHDAAAHLEVICGRAVGAGVCRGLLLHYLADTVLFYTEKSGHLGISHPVISTYLALMHRGEEWGKTDV